VKIFTQSDLPKPKLVAEFTSDEHSCLFATWVLAGRRRPGSSLSLVTIDRIPFPHPMTPVAGAPAALGARAFELIDVPRAATLLAQGVGRLVRSREDRGVVAVLDRRLGKAPYRWQLVHALHPCDGPAQGLRWRPSSLRCARVPRASEIWVFCLSGITDRSPAVA